jgi:hypothetical protein
MKLAGTEEGPWTITLERPLECGAHEEITNWQKDRGVCKKLFCMLPFLLSGNPGYEGVSYRRTPRFDIAQRYTVPTAEQNWGHMSPAKSKEENHEGISIRRRRTGKCSS